MKKGSTYRNNPSSPNHEHTYTVFFAEICVEIYFDSASVHRTSLTKPNIYIHFGSYLGHGCQKKLMEGTRTCVTWRVIDHNLIQIMGGSDSSLLRTYVHGRN